MRFRKVSALSMLTIPRIAPRFRAPAILPQPFVFRSFFLRKNGCILMFGAGQAMNNARIASRFALSALTIPRIAPRYRAFAILPQSFVFRSFFLRKNGCILMFGAGQALRNLFTSKLAPDFRAFDPGIYIFPTNWSFNTAKHSRTHRCKNRTGSEGTLTLPTLVKPMFLAIALALRT